jgi:hypothetical protein
VSTYRTTFAKITWGAGFSNTLSIGYLLDNVKCGDEPRAGSFFDQAPSGVEDSWITGVDYILEAELRWIPPANTTSPLATGWDGTTGVRAFLAYARQKNVVRFYPDAASGTSIDCYLADPMQGHGDVETDGTRRLPLKLRNSTVAFDGY